MKILKKIVKCFYLFVLVMLVIAVIWYNWPQKKEDNYLLLPADALGYGRLRVNWREKAPAQLFDIFWQKIIILNPSLDYKFIKRMILNLLPQEVTFALVYDQEYNKVKKKPDVIALIDFSKKAKLIRLAKYFIDKKSQSSNWRIKNNILIVSSCGLKYHLLKPELGARIEDIIRPKRDNLAVYISNSNNQLSSLLKLLEEKNDFALFPSIEKVDYLTLTGNLNTVNLFNGRLTFVSKYIADGDQIGLDALFLNNMLTRLLLGSGYNYEGTVNSVANYVEINYRINDLNKIWEQFK